MIAQPSINLLLESGAQTALTADGTAQGPNRASCRFRWAWKLLEKVEQKIEREAAFSSREKESLVGKSQHGSEEPYFPQLRGEFIAFSVANKIHLGKLYKYTKRC